MTFTEAYAILEARWPKRSFCIGVTVWKHVREDTKQPKVEFSVYSVERDTHFYAGTLDDAMNQALGGVTTLADVDTVVNLGGRA